MKSSFAKTAALAVGALLLGGVLRAQSFESAHWKSKTEMVGGPQGSMSSETEIWKKDKMMRMKTTVMGMNMNIIRSGDSVYQWTDGQTTGMKMPTNMRRRGGGIDYVNKIAEVRAKGKKIDTEKVAGHVCDVYEYTDAPSERGGKTKETYWLARDLKDFPIKYVSESGDMKITNVNSDIDLAASIPNSLMVVPADVNFQDMSEMMKGMVPKQ